jgi:pyrimidine operon attenuation protein/uracil phosphoribosyltransferase
MTTILDSEQIKRAIDTIAGHIVEDLSPADSVAAVGIRSRGEIIAQRLAVKLSDSLKQNVPCGTLDITLYRDDINSPSQASQPQVRTTEIGFSIDEKVIILVDDVLYTGRSTRAALDALVDLGRPQCIKLAVLVEREGRELPIQADYTGYKADVEVDKVVQVKLVESDGTDEVVIE